MAIQGLPQYLLGYNVSVAGLQSMQVTPAGLFTVLGSAVNMKTLGVFDLFEFQGSNNLTNIKPADYTIANYVPVFDDFTFRVGEIMRAGIIPVLAQQWFNVGAYLRAEIDTADSGADANKFVVIGVRETLSYEAIEEKNVCVITCRPCGILPFCGPGASPI